jgi:nucleotide-binding universal stress UspA family protein
MGRKIVVPHDYGPESDYALTWAAKLVHDKGGTLTLLHVILVPAPPIKKLPMIPILRPTEDPDDSLQKLQAIAERLEVAAAVDVIETNDAGPGIVQRAKQLGAEIVVMGVSHPGRGGLSRAILGSVVDHVVWHAGCPVITVPVVH